MSDKPMHYRILIFEFAFMVVVIIILHTKNDLVSGTCFSRPSQITASASDT